MHKILRNAVIINIVLLSVFIVLDILTLVTLTTGLDSIAGGTFRRGDRIESVWPSYPPFQTVITIGFRPNVQFFSFDTMSASAVNLPLIWFIVTIAINLILIWQSVRVRTIEQKENSKTKS